MENRTARIFGTKSHETYPTIHVDANSHVCFIFPRHMPTISVCIRTYIRDPNELAVYCL